MAGRSRGAARHNCEALSGVTLTTVRMLARVAEPSNVGVKACSGDWHMR